MGFQSAFKSVKESTARNVYGSLFQRRGEAPVNARSPAVTSFVLSVSRVNSASADLVRRGAVRNVTNSVSYTSARLLMHLEVNVKILYFILHDIGNQ